MTEKRRKYEDENDNPVDLAVVAALNMIVNDSAMGVDWSSSTTPSAFDSTPTSVPDFGGFDAGMSGGGGADGSF